MSNEVALYQEKGLTKDESDLVHSWVEKGRPGVHNIKADFLFSIYNLGYSCQDIHKNFPEYPLAGILWAKAKFDWDAKRASVAAKSSQMVAAAIPNVAADSLRQILALIQAANVKNEREVLAYLAAPDREKPPEMLPKTLHQYGDLLTLLKELTTAEKVSKDAPAPPSVFINAPGATVSSVSPQDVAKAMVEQMKSAKKPTNE
jgi:hypothetical protein